MKKGLLIRAWALLLAFLMLSASFLCLPSFAIDIDEEALDDFLWELDFDKMTDISDNMGSTDYTISGKNTNLTEAHGKKALGVVNKNCNYTITDVNNLLDDYDSFSVEADMFFESYPTGTGSNGKTPNEYPMSFLTWVTGEEGASLKYRSIRVDADGFLCTGADPVAKPEQRSSAKLPLGEWFKIRFLVSPLTG
jgi:hypothetical protein